MSYQETYTVIKDMINNLYEQAQANLNTYTPNNVEHIYKYNRYNTLERMKVMLAYYFNGSLSYEITVCSFINYCIRVIQMCTDKDQVGITETCHNMLQSLSYNSTVRKYYYSDDNVHSFMVDKGILNY